MLSHVTKQSTPAEDLVVEQNSNTCDIFITTCYFFPLTVCVKISNVVELQRAVKICHFLSATTSEVQHGEFISPSLRYLF